MRKRAFSPRLYYIVRLSSALPGFFFGTVFLNFGREVFINCLRLLLHLHTYYLIITLRSFLPQKGGAGKVATKCGGRICPTQNKLTSLPRHELWEYIYAPSNHTWAGGGAPPPPLRVKNKSPPLHQKNEYPSQKIHEPFYSIPLFLGHFHCACLFFQSN